MSGRYRVDGVLVCKDCYDAFSVTLRNCRTDREICEDKIYFCLSKCGDDYCEYMRNRNGYPCIEFICKFCNHPHGCDFCRGI